MVIEKKTWPEQFQSILDGNKTFDARIADFPIVLTNWDGLIIAEGYATAKADWMTEDFVEFEAVLEFEKSDYKNNGSLILQKDNPSGLPENDDALEVPIYYADNN